MLAAPDNPKNLTYIDAKNIRFASINSFAFRNEIKKDLIVFPNATQKSVLYLYKKRDIPDANALHQAIFRILTDPQYGFVDPSDPNAYLSISKLNNMGFRGRTLQNQIKLFIKQKFILTED